MITGLVCAVCSTEVGIAEPFSWVCPEAGSEPHLLEFVDDGVVPEDDHSSANPFIRYRRRMAWWAFARANGMDDAATVELASHVADGFAMTPLVRHEALSTAAGVEVWAKDETGALAGSHKARHLASIMLHLRVAEDVGLLTERPPLAISSCGNAAIAASTLAAAAEWPIDVFIPEWAGGMVVDTLDRLGARVHRCPRRTDDPPGDPTVLRFRDAVSSGAIPFSVQGPENALCLDGGRTIGWEIAERLLAAGTSSLDAVYAQVGGGAFAASLSRGMGEGGVSAPLVAVQTEGCAPLARAWERQREERVTARELAADWTHFMWPWENEPVSVADGILDDETYDWVVDLREVERTSGRVVVAPEPVVKRVAQLVPSSTGIDASPTGTAGVAGLLLDIEAGRLTEAHDVLVVLSGVRRD